MAVPVKLIQLSEAKNISIDKLVEDGLKGATSLSEAAERIGTNRISLAAYVNKHYEKKVTVTWVKKGKS